MAAMQTAQDVTVHVRSDNSASERRINPSWTISQFKTRLEPITGIPSTAQSLTLTLRESHPSQPIHSANDDVVQLSAFPLQQYAEIYVHDTRPAHMRQSFNDLSSVEKYTMPTDKYETLTDSVLHWKRTNKLGRFDPDLPDAQAQQAAHVDREISERHIALGRRCRLLPPPSGHQGVPDQAEGGDRRGEIMYVGEIAEISGPGKWIGIALDEPTGKNDGSVKGTRYFNCGANFGVIVRPERVEVGDFPPIDDFAEDMEEI